MNKIKVLHILSSKTYNGAENVVCQINSMLQGTEDNIELIYCSLDGPVRSHIEENRIRFIPVSKIAKKEIARVIREVKPDIIHAHDMRAGFVAALACGKIPLFRTSIITILTLEDCLLNRCCIYMQPSS